jgi:EF-P beta-lysylation protein EpmB
MTDSAWQRELSRAITDPVELCRSLGLDPNLAALDVKFKLRVPRGFVARMRHGDPNDPLLRQVLPVSAELATSEQFLADPLNERAAVKGPGLLQKYRGRALVVTTGVCAVHCRYCFRREFPYQEMVGEGARWSEALAVIAADKSIEEMILSGGDPLSLSDARLTQLTNSLATIPHIKRLRIHTRQPIVLPERVDAGLIGWLKGLRWPVVIVLHINHAQEIDASVREACAQLRAVGALLLNQSVLLQGVNATVPALEALSHSLFEAGILPYYLHLLDRVQGTTHFDLPESTAISLLEELASRLPGYLVPRLVREIRGAKAKQSMRGYPAPPVAPELPPGVAASPS